MQKEIVKKKVIDVFTLLYKEGVSSTFRFPRGQNAKIVDSFVDEFCKAESDLVNLGVIIDYCVHQAYYWREIEKWPRFNITWVFGKKAIERFYKAKTGNRYYQNLWLKENGWSREGLINKFSDYKVHPLKKYIYIESEDYTKRRFLNKEIGLGLCLTLTSLYAPLSPMCQQCKYSDKCSEVLRKKNTELHRLRTT